MKRKIIRINEDLCNGCGNCITGCAEGALQLVDGKAKLVKEQFCDGFGDCIGTCPTGALTIEERECEEFDEAAVREHVRRELGETGVQRLEEVEHRHGINVKLSSSTGGGCPGARAQQFKREHAAPATHGAGPQGQVIRSELEQWPIQLHLVQPQAPFFADRELVILSTCSPATSPDVNWRFVRGRSVVMACPKLDRTEGYVEKLADIFRHNSIPEVIIVRMEVPCCGGLTRLALEARELSGKTGLKLTEAVINLRGDLVQQEAL